MTVPRKIVIPQLLNTLPSDTSFRVYTPGLPYLFRTTTEAISDGASLDYGQLPSELQQVPISFPFAGRPLTGMQVNVPMVMPLAVPALLAGTQVYCAILPTVGAGFTLNKIVGGVVFLLGTITITNSGHTSCVLAGAGGTLFAGEVLQIIAPVQDATLADVGITVLTLRL